MFTIDDLWNLIKYFEQGTSDSSLSELTTTLATSEKINTTDLFEQVLDQETFNTDDYKRLRHYLIDWYSAHKTMATTQRFASDVHQLPNNHLSELFKSFGFPLGLDLVPLTSKANFFLDLVNFYKKKGTPETLVDVLDYYGFSDSDLVEYWLMKDNNENIVFRGESVRQSATGSTLLLDSDVGFEKMTRDDPHWFQSRTDIHNLIISNRINLPSKSPYFSLSSIFSLFTINITLSILHRIVSDQYARHINGHALPFDIHVKNLGIVVPLLHVYIASIYTFEKMFGKQTETNYLNVGCYNGEIIYINDPQVPLGLDTIITEYEALIAKPISKADREARLSILQSLWSAPNSDNFLNVHNIAEPLLEELNPSFKKIIDSWFDIGDQSFLITYLLGTLDSWIRYNVDSKSPSMIIILLGLGFRGELDAIVNFFKPYRARLAFMDTSFAIKNPLTESILLDEGLLTRIEGYYKDPIRPFNFPYDQCSRYNKDLSSYEYPAGLGSAALDLEFKWDSGFTFDNPDMPLLLNPGYAGNPTQYGWDLGTQFDKYPADQMDDDFYDRLKTSLFSGGSVCDSSFISIETFIYETIGARPTDFNYDYGFVYDLPGQITMWPDNLDASVTVESKGKDNVIVQELDILKVEQSINDNFGFGMPTAFDSGFTFDTLSYRSIVKDSFRIDISSCGSSHTTSMVGKPFYNFDTIGMFDEGGTQLHVGEPIALSGRAFCRCRTLRRNLKVIYAIPPA